ncbi:TPA: hypothetical protein ACIBVD_001756 [Salmonella enterica subsp. enterica serovar Javiana]
MKLSEAQDYQRRILDLTKQLNAAISDASKNGLSIEVEVTELHYVGHQPTPSITSFVLINPRDVESL